MLLLVCNVHAVSLNTINTSDPSGHLDGPSYRDRRDKLPSGVKPS